ncbi:MAG TPA: MBL fold metallo-hydrolase [Vicinamibacterales bacterium]|nr:MBL fold metallo-hydrolase [Vicinamibacterales bacterium]
MAQIDEIARDVYRISIHVPELDMQFNHFLVKDDEPLLFHTGMRKMFPAMWEAVGRLIDPTSLRWISWSHFEVDECGALNDWLARAPDARPACGQVGALVNITDYATRPPLALAPGDALTTGRHRFRWVPTPHLPHGWDAGMLFEEQDRVLFCSDLFHQFGSREPVTGADVVGRYGEAIARMQAHPVLMDYMPFTHQTRQRIETLAELEPRVLAAMHGSAYEGDGAAALRAAGDVMEQLLGSAPLASR